MKTHTLFTYLLSNFWPLLLVAMFFFMMFKYLSARTEAENNLNRIIFERQRTMLFKASSRKFQFELRICRLEKLGLNPEHFADSIWWTEDTLK